MDGLVDGQGPFEQDLGLGELSAALQIARGPVQQPGDRFECCWHAESFGVAGGGQDVGEDEPLAVRPGAHVVAFFREAGPQQADSGSGPLLLGVAVEVLADDGLQQTVGGQPVAAHFDQRVAP